MVNVRLPVSLWERVQALALRQRRSASAELAFLLESALPDAATRLQEEEPAPCDT
jgi:hypothetical protein